MERRQDDRTQSERVAVVETQILSIGIMLNRIEKDIHALATQAKSDDSELAKRVAELEKDKYKIMGGWIVISAISMMLMAVMSILDKVGWLK